MSNLTHKDHKGCGKWDCPTHNDGYGHPCNDGYSVPLKDHKEWEKRFDAAFMVMDNHVPNFSEIYTKGDVTEIKAFIREELSHQLTKIQEMVEGMKKEEYQYHTPEYHECNACDVYQSNKLCDDIISKLKEIKQ